MRILHHTVRAATAVLGGALIVLGIVLWLLPVVPGLGLVFVGLPMVMAVHPRGRPLAARWKRQAKALAGRLRSRWRRWRRRRDPRPGAA